MVMRTLPTWGFAKSSPGVIERLKTEIAGAKFVEKLFTATTRKGTTTSTDQNSDGNGASENLSKLDISDILQPKKKAKKTGAGVKAKAKAKGRAGPAGPEAEYDDVAGADAAVPLEHGAERPRWWVDDMLLSLVHAAGGSLSCIVQVQVQFDVQCRTYRTIRTMLID